ncbi:LytS/YhcK type 5TM receptor domain-containing protein [Ferviditalea candida]|uniref:histidine kinase n=1 Tax=Ferviditalea candida TaxID=3108399 RepID=A0ABU5ZGG9_9BACL|nr:LytS/YhcK type 5TM receptor domain-containing protein [Paenibacillaceae bacterium T2]
MEDLTLIMFQRMGTLLIMTFMLTRFPLFRQLLDREVNISTSVYFSVLFGLFGIAGTYAGVVIHDGVPNPSFWLFTLNGNDTIAHSGLVGVVIGGLFGGPVVGLSSGIITGFHLYTLGGFAALANALAAPVTGLFAGWIGRFFSQERVISATKALFIGMFAPILLMGFILIFSSSPEVSIPIVNIIGIPMVITNSISIAIFTTMFRVALKEEERAAAFETQRALKIADLTIPHLKQGLTADTANATAELLMRELKAAAVAVADTDHILSHVGIGRSHHHPGEKLQTELLYKAIATGSIQIAYRRSQIQCAHKKCPLGASIIVPISQAGHVAGLINIYYKRPQQIRSVEIVLAKGLGKLISSQLSLAMSEKISRLMKDTELRVLQAQINPHFLFNTLNSIVTLIRTDPQLARHVTVHLGNFMRQNLKITSSRLIPIAQEMNHLNSYLEIIRIRFADQISIVCEVDEELADVLIPTATLQPLVENCINHGLKEKSANGKIAVQIRKKADRVQVSIEDNGSGIPGHILPLLGEVPISSSEGNGIGVHNVNHRLISLLGVQSRLQIRNKTEGGSRITFSIPIHVQERTG